MADRQVTTRWSDEYCDFDLLVRLESDLGVGSYLSWLCLSIRSTFCVSGLKLPHRSLFVCQLKLTLRSTVLLSLGCWPFIPGRADVTRSDRFAQKLTCHEKNSKMIWPLPNQRKTCTTAKPKWTHTVSARWRKIIGSHNNSILVWPLSNPRKANTTAKPK